MGICPDPRCDDGTIWGLDADGREVAGPCFNAVHAEEGR